MNKTFLMSLSFQILRGLNGLLNKRTHFMIRFFVHCTLFAEFEWVMIIWSICSNLRLADHMLFVANTPQIITRKYVITYVKNTQ